MTNAFKWILATDIQGNFYRREASWVQQWEEPSLQSQVDLGLHNDCSI